MTDRARDAASRRDNPDQWVSGGHEKFETPMRSAASERDLREKLMRESRLQERREGGEAILHGSGPEKPSGIQPAARVHARTYGWSGGYEERDANVAELHWPDGRSVQISGATEDDEIRGGHVLIRVWPENGTHEYGGSNMDDFSVVLRFDGAGWKITSLNARSDRGA